MRLYQLQALLVGLGLLLCGLVAVLDGPALETWERKPANPRRMVPQTRADNPENQPLDRADTRNRPRIVIPVVVGSSPISHPTKSIT